MYMYLQTKLTNISHYKNTNDTEHSKYKKVAVFGIKKILSEIDLKQNK